MKLAQRLALFAALHCLACGQPPDTARVVERSHLAMGSEVRVTAWTTNEFTTIVAIDAAFREFNRLDRLLSVWRDGSDVQRLNVAAGAYKVHVSAEIREVLREARQISLWTNGKFDVTFGALSDLWKFDHDQDNRIPVASDVRARLPLVDYEAIEVDEQNGTVFLMRAGMRIHLGGIGKGFAIDRAVEILRQRGIKDFMIQSGGDLYASGKRDDRPWRVGIRDPRGPADRSFAALDLENATFSTSGDYERFFLENGVRYHHIIDPDLGEPARGCRSVTIVADRATVADGLSTGVFILGPAAGMDLIERLPNVEGVIVTDTNDVLVSSGLTGRLIRLTPPS